MGYSFLIIGDWPDSSLPHSNFRVGFSDSITPELEVTAFQLSVMHGLGKEEEGILNLAWQSPVPVNGMVFFMIPEGMEFHFVRTGTEDMISKEDYTYRQALPGGGLSENDTFYKLPGINYASYYDIDEELNGVLYAIGEYGDKAIGLPLRQPAGERELTLFFQGNMSQFEVRQGWGRHKVFLLAGAKGENIQEQAFPDQQIISLESKWANKPFKISINYSEWREGTTLQEPVPDATQVRYHEMSWIYPSSRDNRMELGIHAIVIDEKTRFYIARFADILLLLLGVLFGVLITPRQSN